MWVDSNSVFNCFPFVSSHERLVPFVILLHTFKTLTFFPQICFFPLKYFQVYTDEILLIIAPVFSEEKTFHLFENEDVTKTYMIRIPFLCFLLAT